MESTRAMLNKFKDSWQCFGNWLMDYRHFNCSGKDNIPRTNLKHCIYQFSLPNTYLSITCFHGACWMKISVFYNWPRCCTAGDMESKERGGNLSNQANAGWDVTIISFIRIFLQHSVILISLRKSDCKSNTGQQILVWFRRDDIPNYEKIHLSYFHFV